ncbi:MAG: hypothetical protein Q7S37_02505 [bacterium]|nr:hypothetical protein [bacterium]
METETKTYLPKADEEHQLTEHRNNRFDSEISDKTTDKSAINHLTTSEETTDNTLDREDESIDSAHHEASTPLTTTTLPEERTFEGTSPSVASQTPESQPDTKVESLNIEPDVVIDFATNNSPEKILDYLQTLSKSSLQSLIVVLDQNPEDREIFEKKLPGVTYEIDHYAHADEDPTKPRFGDYRESAELDQDNQLAHTKSTDSDDHDGNPASAASASEKDINSSTKPEPTLPEGNILESDGPGFISSITGRMKALSPTMGAFLLFSAGSRVEAGSAQESLQRQQGINMAAKAEAIKFLLPSQIKTEMHSGKQYSSFDVKVGQTELIRTLYFSDPQNKEKTGRWDHIAKAQQQYHEFKETLEKLCPDSTTRNTIVREVAKDYLEKFGSPSDKEASSKIGNVSIENATFTDLTTDTTKHLEAIHSIISDSDKQQYLEIMNLANHTINQSAEEAILLDAEHSQSSTTTNPQETTINKE